MHKVLGAGVVWAVLVGSAQAQPLELGGIGVSRDVPCKGQDVVITGNGNQFILSGDCGQVEVHGSEHVVQLGDAASLAVTGGENRIDAARIGGLQVEGTDQQVSAQVEGDGKPAAVAVYGADNVLRLDFHGPVQVEVNGSGQQVNWQGDEPEIATSGIDHRIERQ